MNYNQSYEYEEGVDLLKLIYFCMSKWKNIIAFTICGAILGGALSIVLSNVAFLGKDEEVVKYTGEVIEDKVTELQENNADIASQAVMHSMDQIEESGLVNVDPYNMYLGSFSMFSFAPQEDLVVMESALNSFDANMVLYDKLAQMNDTYSKKDLQQMISLKISNQTDEDKQNNIAVVKVYGATEEEVRFMLDEADKAFKNYLKDFSEHYSELTYFKIDSDITITENLDIAEYQQELYDTLVKSIESKKETKKNIEYRDSEVKTLIIYAFVGAFLTGCMALGVWVVVFFACGKLYTVADIERKFKTNVLGVKAVCNKKNPFDKWIFHKMNGLYSHFSKEEQEKIIVLNIKNEFNKKGNPKKVMLVSSLGEAIKEDALFIKKGLEEAGYTVSDCVNVIGRPDIMETATEYDVALIVENTYASNTEIVAEEIDVINEYMNDCSYMVRV